MRLFIIWITEELQWRDSLRLVCHLIETLRWNFFGNSCKPQTLKSHVISALPSGLRFEDHVCAARPRSGENWFTARVFSSQNITIPRFRGYTKQVKQHVYVIRQTWICITWPSFLFTCHLLFIISTPRLVVSRNFSSIRIVLSCFYPLIFHFEFLNLNLTFAAYVKLKLSTKY